MISAELIYRDFFLENDGCHPRDSIIIVLEGEFECVISGKKYPAGQNDIFVFNKQSHFTRKVISPLKCLYIQFDSFPTPLNDGLLHCRDTARTANTICHLTSAVYTGETELTKHLIRDIFMMRITPHSGLADADIDECIKYMENNLSLPLTLNELSEKFHLSKQWLINKFKKYTNKTPMEYLTMLRINHSKDLLMNSNISIGEIALQCGYDNVYYFSNTFKKHTGISPLKYKNRFRL